MGLRDVITFQGETVAEAQQAFRDSNRRTIWSSAHSRNEPPEKPFYRAGMSLILRDGSAWIMSDEGERLVCEPQDPGHVWFETWLVLHNEYGRLSRLWIGGRPVTEPGE